MYRINGTVCLLCLFYPPVCSYKCKLFLHRIVVTKIELSYFVCFVKPCLPRKKKGVDDIFSLFFFLSTLVRSVCILSIYDWHVCPWGFKTRYSKQILYLSVLIVFVSIQLFLCTKVYFLFFILHNACLDLDWNHKKK